MITCGDCKARYPFRIKNIETNPSVGVDIWMINSCAKFHLSVDTDSCEKAGEITAGGLKG
jgi:hypothetical protein